MSPLKGGYLAMNFRALWFRCLCFSCAAIALSFVPRSYAGEPPWVEIQSPHFSVVTDAGEHRGREVAMRFEQMRLVFGSLMTNAKVNIPVPLQIVAFRNTKELRQFAPLFNGKPTQLAGLFQGGEDRSFIMLDMSVDNPWTVVFHEYAHQLMNGTLTVQMDPWFEEGFAEYFSSIEVDGKEARVGKIPPIEYQIMQQAGSMKIADLFRVRQNSSTYNESGDHRSTFYAESGMLTHYIYDNKLLPKLGTYFSLTEKNVPVEDAIQQAFGMSAAQFDKELRMYIAGGHYLYYRVPTPDTIDSKTYSVKPLSAPDSNAVLADIHLHSRDYRDQAITEFQELLKTDPNNSAANRGLGYAYLQKREFDQAGQYFQRAAQEDSKDPRVHYYSALLMSRLGTFSDHSNLSAVTKELETSIALDANFADAYSLLAFAQMYEGDPAKGLETMRKAVAINPRNETYQFDLAQMYSNNGKFDEAIALFQALEKVQSPMLAMRIRQSLAQAQAMKENGRPSRDQGEMAQAVVLTHRENSRPQPESSTEAAPIPSSPPRFLKGIITAVDCSTPPSAVLTMASGTKTLALKIADTNHLVLIGADQFSCSWQKQKVAVNYRETGSDTGSIVSLEVQ